MKQFIYIVLALILFSCSKVVSQTVYITKNEEKVEYHQIDCKLLKGKNIKEIQLDVVQFLEYEACRVCNFSKYETEHNDSIDFTIISKLKQKKTKTQTKKRYKKNKKNYQNKISKKGSSYRRCSGKTRKGKRCKRRVKGSNERCWQH